MIINFPFLKLPSDFVELLKDDFRDAKGQERRIEAFFKKNPSLRVLIEQDSWESNENHSIGSLIKSYGWKLVRDRLAIFYLNKFEFGTFEVRHEDNYFLKEILELEELFYDFSTSGTSRLFLLGLYLRMSEFNLARKIGHTEINFVKSIKSTLPYLKSYPSKSLRVDWLILCTMHFLEYYGEDDFSTVLENCEYEYELLYEDMEESFKKTMLQNMLSYGSSIDDQYVLLNDIN